MAFLLVIIAILIALLIFVLVKYRTVKKREFVSLQHINEAKTILQNIGAYFLLIDKDYIVHETNYYFLNGISVDSSVQRVGDLLHCRNAIEAGECGKHEHCKLCSVRLSIGKSFNQKKGFRRLSASMKLLSKDGSAVIPCDVAVSSTYLMMQGEDRLLLTIFDASELKNMERLLEIERQNAISADKLKSSFIANMSHEIRTPLNAIVGFSGLISSASTEEEKRMFSDIITQNNERLLRIIDDIFDLSQIESGTLNFDYSEFDVNDVLRELYGMYQLKPRENPDVDLVCDSHLNAIMLYSERQRVLQIMINFLHNAIKFTKSGEIRFGCTLLDANEVCFYVSDTGVGIPEEVQHEIFSRFMKLDREVPGTGLGLTLCQTIVENLGGKIGVQSKLNKGSTFWFTLPLTSKQIV